MSLRNQRGAVLLLVLVVVALLSALLTDWAFSTLVDLRLTETFRDSNRAYYLARGGVEVGRQLLWMDKNNYDAPSEMWGVGIPAYPVSDEATVSISIVDEDGRFNLNKVVDNLGENPNPLWRDRLRRLLTHLEIDDPEALSDALIDWIDRNQSTSPHGAENSWYQGLASPLASKDGPLDTVDELLLVKGFTPEIVQKLTPYVTVSDTVTGVSRLNLNSAGKDLLLIWDSGVDTSTIELLLERRQEKPFKSLAEVQETIGIENYSALNRNLDIAVVSQFYQISSVAQVNDGVRTVQVLLEKAANRQIWRRVF
jgi:general secretion pathway protein K